jgi:hypothetical protein
MITPKDLTLRSCKLKALAIHGSTKLLIICNSCGDRAKFCPHTVFRCKEVKI